MLALKKPRLWEWLVCIPIVAFLVLVFWPVHSSGGSSRRSACLSSIKQLSLAILMYSSDYNDQLPHRDAWMDVIGPYTKNPKLFQDIEVKGEGLYGFSFDSRLSTKVAATFQEPAKQTMLFDSINLGRNASDPVTSLPSPGRHSGRNNMGYLDAHAKPYLSPGARP